jgi:hypothetical protein
MKADKLHAHATAFAIGCRQGALRNQQANWAPLCDAHTMRLVPAVLCSLFQPGNSGHHH